MKTARQRLYKSDYFTVEVAVDYHHAQLRARNQTPYAYSQLSKKLCIADVISNTAEDIYGDPWAPNIEFQVWDAVMRKPTLQYGTNIGYDWLGLSLNELYGIAWTVKHESSWFVYDENAVTDVPAREISLLEWLPLFEAYLANNG